MRKFTDDERDFMLDVFFDEVLSEGTAEDVEHFIEEEGVNPLMLCSDGWTWAHKAAWEGNSDAVELLMDGYHVDPNAIGGQDFNPKVDPSKLTPRQLQDGEYQPPQCTALHLAAIRGWDDVVEELLQRPDIKVDVKDGRGKTPLDYAQISGRAEVVEMLENAIDTGC